MPLSPTSNAWSISFLGEAQEARRGRPWRQQPRPPRTVSSAALRACPSAKRLHLSRGGNAPGGVSGGAGTVHVGAAEELAARVRWEVDGHLRLEDAVVDAAAGDLGDRRGVGCHVKQGCGMPCQTRVVGTPRRRSARACGRGEGAPAHEMAAGPVGAGAFGAAGSAGEAGRLRKRHDEARGAAFEFTPASNSWGTERRRSGRAIPTGRRRNTRSANPKQTSACVTSAAEYRHASECALGMQLSPGYDGSEAPNCSCDLIHIVHWAALSQCPAWLRARHVSHARARFSRELVVISSLGRGVSDGTPSESPSLLSVHSRLRTQTVCRVRPPEAGVECLEVLLKATKERLAAS